MKNPKILILAEIAGILIIFGMHTLQVSATTVTIDVNLSVTPNVISFETVFPGEVHFRPLNIDLSGSFIESSIHDDVEYQIVQRPKPRIDDPEERAYCLLHPEDLSRCYPSLCPYLSKEADNQPGNDTSVPAFHDPTATSSIAFGRLAKSDDDLEDNWIIDLHTPCFRGECDQTNSVPVQYQLDSSLRGQTFGCDLVVEVVEVSYFQTTTRTIGFWGPHTAFTSSVFQNQLGGSMTVGAGSHTRTITNTSGNGQSRLFGAFFSSIPKKTNNQNRANIDKARMQLLQQLVAAKLNCAAFSCTPATQTVITNADGAYATGTAAQILAAASQLDAYNNSGDANAIPGSLGPIGSATPATSQAKANKVFWNSP
ncbi:MAG: hypothetical protein AAB490_06210 [Patescibacteria group bacterium]